MRLMGPSGAQTGPRDQILSANCDTWLSVHSSSSCLSIERRKTARSRLTGLWIFRGILGQLIIYYPSDAAGARLPVLRHFVKTIARHGWACVLPGHQSVVSWLLCLAAGIVQCQLRSSHRSSNIVCAWDGVGGVIAKQRVPQRSVCGRCASSSEQTRARPCGGLTSAYEEILSLVSRCCS